MQGRLLGFRQKPALINVLGFAFLALAVMTLLGGVLKQDLRYASESIMRQDFFCEATAALALAAVTRVGYLYFMALSAYFFAFEAAYLLWIGGEGPFKGAVLAVWAIAFGVMAVTRIRFPYLFPETRWWKRPPRVVHQAGGMMYFKGIKFPIVMMDLSNRGTFVKLDMRLLESEFQKPDEERRRHGGFDATTLSPEERILARKSIGLYPQMKDRVAIVVKTLSGLDNPFDGNFFETEAQVVWTTKITDPMRWGLGLKFMDLNHSNHSKLKSYLRYYRQALSAGPKPDETHKLKPALF